MSISSNLTKLTTDITNAYTSIDNKGGTIPANKNTNNLPTAINSIEVIEQATAEGESLSLVNTKAMPYSDYVVKGKSEQTTRSGKNLLQNTAKSQTISGVTFTVNEDRSVTCNGTATNNIFFSLTGNNSIENIILNGCPAGGSGDSYLVRAIDTNGKVLKTDVGEGTEVFNLINARIQIRIAKDYICNNLTFYPMIRLATIEDDTYEPYGASPSPDYPSEIHSVADDVNLFDASKIQQSSIVVTDNGKTIELPIISSGNGNINTNTFLKDLCPELNVGDVVYLNFTRNINPGKNNFIFLYNNTMSPPAVEWDNGTSKTIDQNLLDSYVILYGNKAQDGETQQIILTNFKIQKGTVVTPYSPYNQGTVTIKQRGKNLANNNFEEWTTDDAYAYIPITLEQGKTYILSATRVGELKTLYYNFGIVKDGTKYSDFVLLRTCIDYTTGDTSTVTFTVDNTYTNPKLVAYVGRSQSKFNELFANYNIQLEERNTGYLLRTISNTTRLHYPNRTIT